MKVTVKGQVTIPQHIRRHLGVMPHTEVDFRIVNGEVVLVKVDPVRSAPNKSRFEAYRGSKADGPSTAEWMAATRGE